jgi:hypothetical protein
MIAPQISAAPIGVVVHSDSHVLYWCQIYGQREVAQPPAPQDYAFGRFVRAALPAGDTPRLLVGVICDTVLVNPGFGSVGPRLSTGDEQRAVFSPDYLVERATLVQLLALGTTDLDGARPQHGVPSLALELDAVVTPLDDAGVRTFHWFASDNGTPSLHLGYLPQMIAQPAGLLPQAARRILEQLEALFPENRPMLSIVRRNLEWKLSVATAG